MRTPFAKNKKVLFEMSHGQKPECPVYCSYNFIPNTKFKKFLLPIVALSAALPSIQASAPYTPDWTSLRRHNTPEWMEDMKFGIYSHWGAQTAVTASGNMEMPYH
jgi:hypothetical protein